ncbi:MAG: PTS-dependent dihydroxyacetone kinase phosphotransferase subunit DhaM [Selenomonadaceae bacterium]|nr:PTS-dependent dihydroxyacetone kinase phosphotransferase subunit DhaM [Selenomonadaceae bacterium]
MVGLVIVSHSQKLAEGVVELARAMADEVRIAAAGGLEDGTLGTSYQRIHDAIEEVYSEDGVAILMDMGSAVMTAEMVLEDLDKDNVVLVDCPLVEGAVLAAVESATGSSLQTLIDRTKDSYVTKKIVTDFE